MILVILSIKQVVILRQHWAIIVEMSRNEGRVAPKNPSLEKLEEKNLLRSTRVVEDSIRVGGRRYSIRKLEWIQVWKNFKTLLQNWFFFLSQIQDGF